MKSMQKKLIIACCLLLMLPIIGFATRQYNDTPDRSSGLTLDRCVVMPAEQFAIPARETGTLVQLNISDGQPIVINQLIGLIDDGPALMALSASHARFTASTKEADNESAIEEAQAALRVANNERDRKARLLENRTITEAEFEQARLAAEYAEVALRNRRYQREIDRLRADVDGQEVNAAQLQVDRHEILAPINGNVLQILTRQNEWVQAGDPIANIVRMDHLRVEGQFDGNLYNPEEIMGRRVTIRAERARGQFVEFTGQVVYVSLRQSAGKKYQVRAEVQNRDVDGYWLLNPGATVSMTILFD